MPKTVLPTAALVLLCCAATLMGCATVDVVRIKTESTTAMGCAIGYPRPT